LTTFCTITTPRFFAFAKALLYSLKQFDKDVQLTVLVTEEGLAEKEDGITVLNAKELCNIPAFAAIRKQYPDANNDSYRWALKPLLIKHLLESDFGKVIYCDPDIYFTGDYHFLSAKLNNTGILLTPHWHSISTERLDETLPALYRGGLFNAGFIGASKKGLQAITWWLSACIYKMDHTELSGYFDDQKYLDVLPIEFDSIEIIKHRGCNLACWNIEANKRGMMDSKLLINEEYEPVFIHFTKNTADHIFKGYDELLRPYLTNYIGLLKENGFDADKFYPDTDKLTGISIFENLKRKTLIRTRLKRFLTKLIKKI
jgi:hypothetical protein